MKSEYGKRSIVVVVERVFCPGINMVVVEVLAFTGLGSTFKIGVLSWLEIQPMMNMKNNANTTDLAR